MAIATGEKMYAEDMLNLLFFPKGAILMYDGTSWQDNVTLKGWYQCQGQSTPYGNTPDLRDKFIMGYNGGSRTGGNNSLTLSTTNLPTHTHSISGSTGNPSKNLTGSFGVDDSMVTSAVYSTSEMMSLTNYNYDMGSSYGGDAKKLSIDATHTHTISGSVSNAGSSLPFDNRPSYYSLIYIIKMTNAGQ
jgi:microcystin-dependent protein